MHLNLNLRPIQASDVQAICDAFQAQGWESKQPALYEKYLKMQASAERDIIIAEYEQQFAGYLTIIWQPEYPYFKQNAIPEIGDFNVLQKFQRRGFGTALMDEAERRIKAVSDYAGIGFGVYKDYGKAQILYINRGYIPDGNGIVKDGKSLPYGEAVTIDDDLVFYLTKQLSH